MATPREFGQAVIGRDITIEKQQREIEMLQAQQATLDRILSDAIGLFIEYEDLHGYEREAAKNAAILDTMEGVRAEQELAAEGEANPPNQPLNPTAGGSHDSGASLK